jgi:hypothetical protein
MIRDCREDETYVKTHPSFLPFIQAHKTQKLSHLLPAAWPTVDELMEMDFYFITPRLRQV